MTTPKSKTTVQFNKNTLSLDGDLEFSTVMSVLNESLHYLSAGAAITIDFAKVDYSDSSALALVCEWLRIAKRRHIALSFKNVPLQLRRTAKVSELQDLFISFA